MGEERPVRSRAGPVRSGPRCHYGHGRKATVRFGWEAQSSRQRWPRGRSSAGDGARLGALFEARVQRPKGMILRDCQVIWLVSNEVRQLYRDNVE